MEKVLYEEKNQPDQFAPAGLKPENQHPHEDNSILVIGGFVYIIIQTDREGQFESLKVKTKSVKLWNPPARRNGWRMCIVRTLRMNRRANY